MKILNEDDQNYVEMISHQYGKDIWIEHFNWVRLATIQLKEDEKSLSAYARVLLWWVFFPLMFFYTLCFEIPRAFIFRAQCRKLIRKQKDSSKDYKENE